MDRTNAFDCLHHGILLAKLQFCGFDADALKIAILLSLSLQFKKESTWKIRHLACLTNGVSQESVLGPLIFLFEL